MNARRGVISAGQVALLLASTRLTFVLCRSPELVTAPVTGWRTSVVSLFGGVALVLLYLLIARRTPERDLFGASLTLLGRPLGSLVCGFYVLYFLLLNAVVIRIMADLFASALLPETPIDFFVIAVSGVVLYALYNGIETLGRAAQALLPISIAILLISLAAGWGRADILLALPLIRGSVPTLLRESISPVVAAGGAVLLLTMHPNVVDRRRLRWMSIAAVGGMGVVMLIATVTVTAVLGGPLALLMHHRTFETGKVITIGRFIEQLEPVIVVVWVIAWFFHSSILVMAAANGAAKLFGIRDTRAFLFPFTAIGAAGSIMVVRDNLELEMILEPQIWGLLGVLPVLGFPLLLIATSVVRGRSKRRRGGDEDASGKGGGRGGDDDDVR